MQPFPKPMPGALRPAIISLSVVLAFALLSVASPVQALSSDAHSAGGPAPANSARQAVPTTTPMNTPPDTTITEAPPNPQSYSSEFSFTGTDAETPSDQLTFECSLDGAPFAACTSPVEVADLLPGFHNFQVRAVDAGGALDPTPASYIWEVRPVCNFSIATIYVDYTGIVRGGPGNGQPYNGTLEGTDGSDVMFGSFLSEAINGRGGADLICAGQGDDTIHGNGGADTIYGIAGNNTIYGDGGNDTIYGGAGNDTIRGGDGNDALNGVLGNDLLYGENNNDTLTGGQGADFFSGGPGSDTNTDFKPMQGDTKDGT